MGADKRRRRSSSQKGKAVEKTATGQVPSPPKAQWWKSTWAKLLSTATILAALLGIPPLVNNFVDGAAKLPDTVALVRAWIRGDKHFTGGWTNDPWPAKEGANSVGPPLVGLELQPRPSRTSPDHGSVSLKLEVKDGLVTGEITSQNIREHFIYSHLFVSGVVSFGKLKIHVWDYVSGEAKPIAGLEAHWEKVGGEERLEVTSAGVLFPSHFYVARGVGPEPSMNVDLVKRLSNGAAKPHPVPTSTR